MNNREAVELSRELDRLTREVKSARDRHDFLAMTLDRVDDSILTMQQRVHELRTQLQSAESLLQKLEYKKANAPMLLRSTEDAVAEAEAALKQHVQKIIQQGAVQHA